MKMFEKTLAVGVGVEVDDIAALHVGERRARRPLRQTRRVPGSALTLIFRFDFSEPELKLGPLLRQPFCESEEILRAQEKAAGGALRPAQAQRFAEPPLCRQRVVAGQVGATHRRKLRGGGDAFEQRRFARAILAHEKRHRTGDVERIERADSRNRERKDDLLDSLASNRREMNQSAGAGSAMGARARRPKRCWNASR